MCTNLNFKDLLIGTDLLNIRNKYVYTFFSISL